MDDGTVYPRPRRASVDEMRAQVERHARRRSHQDPARVQRARVSGAEERRMMVQAHGSYSAAQPAMAALMSMETREMRTWR